MRRIRILQIKDGTRASVDRALKGEEFTISRRGKEAAKPAFVGQRPGRTPREVVEHIRQSRKGGHLPAAYTLRRLSEEGRRS